MKAEPKGSAFLLCLGFYSTWPVKHQQRFICLLLSATTHTFALPFRWCDVWQKEETEKQERKRQVLRQDWQKG